MSSAGQIVGGVIGGAIGFMAGGNVMLGVSIGASIGGYIDPPKGANSVGPRLEDLTVQTSTYGAVLPRIKGTVAVTGNVFWLEGDKLKEITNTKKVGGKGGPTSKQTTFSYTATFAVGLSQQVAAPIAGIRRLWLANTLVYDAGSGDLNSIIASNQQAGVMFKVYDGSDDQQPDPRMQADKGIANVSGYPGRAYIVFYDLDLTEKYNNTLMATQVKAEVVCGTASPEYDVLQTMAGDYYYTAGREISCASFGLAKATYGVIKYDPWGGNPLAVEFWETEYGVKEKQVGGYSLASVGFAHAPFNLFISDADRPTLIHVEGFDDGFGHTDVKVYWHEFSGTTSVTSLLSHVDFSYLNYTAAVDGGDTYLTYRGGSNVIKFSGTTIALRSAASYRIKHAGLSESYLFGIYDSGYPASSTTVYKFDRATLALLDTYVQPVTATWAAIKVIDDDTFYTLSDDDVYKWEGGVVVSTVVSLLPYTGQDGASVWFNVLSDSPVYAFLLTTIGTSTRTAYVAHEVVSTQAAKLRDIVTEECALAGIDASDLDLTELINSDVRGYRVSQAGSVRAVLEQLQAAFPFDVIQSGYKLKFKSRGSAAVLTVPEADLGAHSGGDVPSRFALTTEMPSQIPAKVTFNFLNADREYDPDEQSAAFTAQDVKNSYTVSLPLVMTPTEALQAADVLLKKEQRERTSAGTFWLPPSDDYRKLEAADVIDVIAQGRTHTLRLIKVTQLPDGRIECDGKITASAAYASTASAQDSLVLGQSLVPLRGSSDLLLLDIPRIVADQDAVGLAASMVGYTSGWPGATAFRSDDSGQSYAAVASFLAKTETFTAGSALSAATGYAVDNASALTVTPNWSGADLFSITEAQLYAHGNLAAYGADGRWEILCFMTVSTSGSNYILRDFRRGLYGTEWASALHQTGDLLVMLDEAALQFIGLPTQTINSVRLWRGVTSGQAIDSAAPFEHTYAGVNYKTLAPVDLNGTRVGDSRDWTLIVQRRTRTPVEVFSGLSVPLGETAESYDFEIWNSAFTVLVRSFIGMPTAACTYTGAQQVADFGSEQQTLYVKVYQISPLLGRGYPLQSTITRIISADPFSDSVIFLLQMEGANGSTTFIDEKGHGVTVIGAAQITTTDPLSGTSSGLFNGSNTGLVINDAADLEIGSSDFTLEAFIKFSGYSAAFTGTYAAAIIGKDTIGARAFNWRIQGTASSWTSMILQTNGVDISVSTTMANNTRYHVAVCKSGTSLRFFLDGVQQGATQTHNTAIPNVATNYSIGYVFYSGYNYNFPGRLDAVRATLAARYTSNFTPPTSLPNP